MVKDNRKKVLFVIPSLAGGGAERVLLYILKNIDRGKFIPSLVLFEKKGVYLEQVPNDIIIYGLNKRNKFDFFKLIFKLAYKIYPEIKPDVVVGFLNYANYIAVFAKMISFTFKPSVVISEHSPSSLSLKFQRFKIINAWIARKLYPKADKIIAVSEGVKEDLVNSFCVPAKKVQVTYNCVDSSLIESLSKQPVNDYIAEEIFTIIACGRLIDLKNYPLLLKAFSVVTSVNSAKLLILGEGEEKGRLKDLACKLGIYEKVEFLGFKKNPFKYMAKANIFVSSSYFEGFGNVIIEAMSCGVAVISTDCPSGPNEIITNGVNGLLVPVNDKVALTEAILRLFNDEPFRKQLAEAGKKRAKDFTLKKMVTEYEKVIKEVIANRNG